MDELKKIMKQPYVFQKILAFFPVLRYNDFDNCIMREHGCKGDIMKKGRMVKNLLLLMALTLVLGGCKDKKDEHCLLYTSKNTVTKRLPRVKLGREGSAKGTR